MSALPNGIIKKPGIASFVAVGIGGVFGACARYSISLLFNPTHGFPYATFTVNLIGCLLLGYILNQVRLKQLLGPTILLAIGTGVLGSFTTFSTFALETVELWQTNYLLSVSYVILSLILGLFASFIGYTLAGKGRVGK